ncbi:Predicted DNA binding protein, contains HTH domain [Halogranum rubrum]|uniref:Predicted DNA binding protein, contains HTH domain n=1 Tax=Halogranum rubrum TaxID=553466 RepID=A0A1I4EMD5_9EURY|nr:helix-turn-helix domain-containing protein [Halogranum rubrum]SFL05697.1 Predicted DNA binding protein, contains HTH domain [Halogranum rubrum]
MPIAEFRSETPILRRAIDVAPSTRVTVVDDRMPPNGAMKLIFRAEGDDLDAFERGLGLDPTIADARKLDETASRRLIRVNYSERGVEESITPVVTAEDAMLSEATVTDDGFWVRVWFPDRDSLRRIREWSQDRGRSFDVEKIYNDELTDSETPYGLTEAQLEAIQYCYRDGYFEVPRSTTCSAVADDLGISSQSLSERLRRGLTSVIDGSGLAIKSE